MYFHSCCIVAMEEYPGYPGTNGETEGMEGMEGMEEGGAVGQEETQEILR